MIEIGIRAEESCEELIDLLATNHMMRKLGLLPQRLTPGVAEMHVPADQTDEFYAGMKRGLMLAHAWLGEECECAFDLVEIAEEVASRISCTKPLPPIE